MKTVIFCGGRGTRLNEETEKLPKPLIYLADGRPIIWHIMSIYSYYGFNKFVLCLGYKGHIFKEILEKYSNFEIEYVDTGQESGTAERLRRIEKYVGDRFFLTYGDGLADINIKSLLKFHNSGKKIGTVSAVRPLVRFGMLETDGQDVKSFRKYEAPTQGWIDGGFFVFENRIFEYLKSVKEKDMFEGEPLENLSSDGELRAYKHEEYWQCIDTYRDLLSVNKAISFGNDKWKVW